MDGSEYALNSLALSRSPFSKMQIMRVRDIVQQTLTYFDADTRLNPQAHILTKNNDRSSTNTTGL